MICFYLSAIRSLANEITSNSIYHPIWNELFSSTSSTLSGAILSRSWSAAFCLEPNKSFTGSSTECLLRFILRSGRKTRIANVSSNASRSNRFSPTRRTFLTRWCNSKTNVLWINNMPANNLVSLLNRIETTCRYCEMFRRIFFFTHFVQQSGVRSARGSGYRVRLARLGYRERERTCL